MSVQPPWRKANRELSSIHVSPDTIALSASIQHHPNAQEVSTSMEPLTPSPSQTRITLPTTLNLNSLLTIIGTFFLITPISGITPITGLTTLCAVNPPPPLSNPSFSNQTHLHPKSEEKNNLPNLPSHHATSPRSNRSPNATSPKPHASAPSSPAPST